jgi:hypothetical protein
MIIKSANKDYIEKAKNLTYKELEQVLSRMRGKPILKAEDKKLTTTEAKSLFLLVRPR